MKWSIEDDYEIVYAILKEYVVEKKINSVEEFIKTLSLVNKFSEGTLRCKIQNIKCILDEYNLDNSLKVSSLANYSKQNKEQFLRACHDLDIIL